MFSQPAQSNLPVSATQPDQQMYIQGLPQNIPFQIPMQLPPNQQPMLAPCAGMFLQELQNNAGKNGMRIFAFNYLSRNQYQNQEFMEAVKGVVEYADMLINTKQYDPQQAVAQAANEMATIMSSLFAKQFPELLRYAPQGADQEADRWMARMNSIRVEVDKWMKAQQNQHWGQQNGMGGPLNQQPQQNWPQPQQNWQQPQQNWQQPQQQVWGGQQQHWQQPQQAQVWGGQAPQPNPPYGASPHQSAYYSRNNPGQMGVGSQQQNGMFQTSQQNPPQNTMSAGVRGSSLGRRKHRAITESMDENGYNDYRTPEQVQADNVRQQQRQFADVSGSGDFVTQTPESFPNVDMVSSNVEPEFSSEPFAEEKPSREMDRIETAEKVAMPAHLSGLEATYSIKRPYRIAYDPKKQVKFHVLTRSTGDIVELVEEANDEMDYLTHETDPRVKRNLPKPEDGKIIAAEDIFVDKSHVKLPNDLKDVSEEVLTDITEGKKMLVLPNIYTATSPVVARCLARLETRDQGLSDQWSRRPIQFSYNQVFPLVNQSVDKEDGHELDLKEILNVTLELDNVDDYLKQLHRLHKNRNFPRDVLAMLNHYSTVAVNEALQYGIGLDWDIDSFMENWNGGADEQSLEDDFLEEFGAEQGAALYATLLEKSGPRIIGGGLRVLHGDDLKACFDSGGALEQMKSHQKDLVVLAEFHTQTFVQWESGELSLDLEEGGAVLLESKLPKLHGAVKEMIDEARKSYSGFQRLSIVTSDMVMIDVHEGILGKDFLVLDSRTQ